MQVTFAQMLVTALLSSGLVGGIIALLTKTVWSPESKNDLARLGNEFAQQLLSDAKSERQELRLTIHELEQSISTKNDAIERLKQLAAEKDRVISELEERRLKMAQKLQAGTAITLQDIFGDKAPREFHITLDEVV